MAKLAVRGNSGRSGRIQGGWRQKGPMRVKIGAFHRDKSMKLFRHGPQGAEKPGLLDASGALRDLSGVLTDITPATLCLVERVVVRGA